MTSLGASEPEKPGESPGSVPDRLADLLSQALAMGAAELRFESEERSGIVFVFDGAVAWVVAGRDAERLSDVLERREALPPAALRDCFAACRGTGENFAESLVARGLVSREGMRSALLEHNARQPDQPPKSAADVWNRQFQPAH